MNSGQPMPLYLHNQSNVSTGLQGAKMHHVKQSGVKDAKNGKEAMVQKSNNKTKNN